MRVGIATDHGGFSLKEELLTRLRAAGHEIVDFGAYALEAARRLPRLRRSARECRGCGTGGARRGDLRQRRRRVGVREQGRRHSGRARPRSLLRAARRRGRSPQYPLHGRTDGRACRRLGPRRDVPRRPSSVRRNGICAASGKWRAWKRRPATRAQSAEIAPRRSEGAIELMHGTSFPLGATICPGGVNFSVFSKHATGVQLLFFDRVDAAAPDAGRRSRPAAPAFVPLLARVRARHHGRSALRLPRRWAVRSGTRTSLRPRQGAARSLRKMRGTACGLEPRGGVRARRQLRFGFEERRRRPWCVRLGGRPSSAHAICQDGCLRDARGRLHAAPQLRRRGSRGAARMQG